MRIDFQEIFQMIRHQESDFSWNWLTQNCSNWFVKWNQWNYFDLQRVSDMAFLKRLKKLSFQCLCGWTLWRNQEFLTFQTDDFSDFWCLAFFLEQTNFNFELHHGSGQSKSPNVKVPLEFQPKGNFSRRLWRIASIGWISKKTHR